MKYQVILADPPWPYNDKGIRGGVKHHYATKLSMADLRGLRVCDIADENCALFLWVTGPFMLEGIKLLKAWGFVYKSVAFTWVKENTKTPSLFWGTGHYTRSNAEYVLLGLRGKMKRQSASVHSIVKLPRMKHSAKPSEVHGRIEELFGYVPRVELFARQCRDGWSATGLEYDGLDVREYIEREAPIRGKLAVFGSRA